MSTNRLEAFSDGVLAIIITIMVLELKAPEEATLEALKPLAHDLLSYVLSFLYVGIYWNNHHHLVKATKRVGGGILWANLHLLFWLSLFPFVTAWMGRTEAMPIPTAVYGGILLMAAIAYYMLELAITAHRENAQVKAALGRDWKGKLSPAIYCSGMVMAFVAPWVSVSLYAAAALIWLIPDRRFERGLAEEE
jgi:uncharacterized membrane protein